ncbi:hypothetical protein E4U34_005566 [Claviceps purpurea]|nr:hypothetical protein E4U51_004601 [Claviceps purpurea]KAG6186194.1 hypothetical protein E4U10_005851 [Claviceps purpurea]KAG6215639.1 hypothetical protein E4U34_005566 [Claviceps purpurea]
MPEVRKVDEIEGFARLPAALALVLHAFLDIAYDVEYYAVPVDRCLDKDGVVIQRYPDIFNAKNIPAVEPGL